MEALQVKEVVLVAQDLAAYGRDQGVGEKSIIPLMEEIGEKVGMGETSLPLPIRVKYTVDRGD